MAESTATGCASDPFAQARKAQLTLRSDLHASRQVYQGSPVYVVHDPISFRSHRLTVFQYRVLAMLAPDQTLGENFQQLVNKGELEASDEATFYELISSFARLGLVIMPGADGAKLYEQYRRSRKARRRGNILSILFLKIPLVNPDRFLSRTVHRVAWMFTWSFFWIWLVGLASAGFVIVSRFDEVAAPFNSILATHNLPFLWLAFVVLKVWHELGHGYACKVYGGYVPEMGTILIAGTPAAFVDASTAWSFPDRRQRLIVMCGGMFFESLVFILSVFVWAFSGSPMLSSCAYQLFVMSSLVTVLFNANPLMKFDGYFITSELLGIQNLRPRADAEIKRWLARMFLGLRYPSTTDSVGQRLVLVVYGVSAVIYKFFVVLGIAVLVATKFPLVGIGLAAFHILTTASLGITKMLKYLLSSRDTESVRARARLVAILTLVGVPAALFLVPVPTGVVTYGTVAAAREQFLNVDSPGEFDQPLVTAGQPVDAGTVLVRLRNERLEEELAVTKASLEDAVLRWEVLQTLDPAAADRQKAAVLELQKQYQEGQKRVQKLAVTASQSGHVVRLIRPTDRGKYLQEGSPVAVVVDGETLIRTWVNEEQLGSIAAAPGTEVRFRIPGDSTRTYTGSIVTVQPAAEQVFQNQALTYVAGGDILVDPTTQRPLKPLFQIDIKPHDPVLQLTEHGTRIVIRLPRRYESVAAWTTRKCMRFVEQLLAG